MAARKKDELRRQLRDALRKAVDLERRFGIREDARPELEAHWEQVIDLLERVLG
jgi:hypothetical protein